MPAPEIVQIPVLTDNYVYLIHDRQGGETAVVDPAEAAPVQAALDARGWSLGLILNTHHHGDHTGGNLALKKASGCKVVGAAGDAARIPGIDIGLGEGDEIAVGAHTARVFEVPGHTRGHIAYFFASGPALFPGDTLFSLGCGRLFEGTAEQMWTSLRKLRALPDATMVYPAHEYTNANADFALSLDPDNPALKARADEVLDLRQRGLPTVPSGLAQEKALNPFLRADDPGLLAAAGLEGMDGPRAFGEIRRRKDHF